MLRVRQRVKKLHTREIKFTKRSKKDHFNPKSLKNISIKTAHSNQETCHKSSLLKKVHHNRQFVSFIHLFCLIIAILHDFTPKILIYSYLVFHVKNLVLGRNRLIKRDNIT